MKYGLSEKQLTEICDILASHPAVEEAVIYGSRAIDTYKEASDVDIAIKGTKTDHSLAAKFKYQLEEETHLPFFFDITAYNTIDNAELKKHIRTKGKTIYRKGWREMRLGEMSVINTGKSNSQDAIYTGKYPLFDRSMLIKRSDKYLFDKEAIIIPGEGKEFIPKHYNGKFDLHQRCYAIHSFNKEFIPKFCYYYLTNHKEYFRSVAVGSTVLSLRLGHFEHLPIYLPPLSEQKAIAEILSSLDDKIDLLHRQNKTLEDMAQTLFRKWFIEDADEEWKIGTISDEFDFTMGQSPPSDSYNEEGIGVPMFQGNADFGSRFPQNRVYTTKPNRFAEIFDTLISVRAPVGEQNMAKERCCIGRGVASFRYKHDSKCYTYTYFKLRSLMKEIKKFNDVGTVFGSISKTDFQKMELVLPPREVVQQYEHEATATNEKIIKNCYQMNMLRKFQKTLLPKLINGEVRVIDENIKNTQ